MNSYDKIRLAGPSCLSLHLVDEADKFGCWYDPDFVFVKVYKNIESVIFFIEHIQEIDSKFWFNIGLRWSDKSKTDLANTVDTTYFHFDFSKFNVSSDDVDVSWHFGLYKKYAENLKIDCERFMLSLFETHEMVVKKFMDDRQRFLDNLKREQDDEILFVRAETFEDCEKYGSEIVGQHINLLNALRRYWPKAELMTVCPSSIKDLVKSDKYIIKFIDDLSWKKIMDFDSYRFGRKLDQYEKDLIKETFKDIDLKRGI